MKKVIFCNCNSKIIEEDRLAGISEYLEQAGNSFVKISDLCGCSVDQKNEISVRFSDADEVLFVACYPRAVQLLLQKCDVDLQSVSVKYLNFRELDNHQIFSEIAGFFAGEEGRQEPSEIRNPTDWPSWFPLIDYSRCSSCGQCADFCLFGVYEKQDNQIVVVHPKGCKTNCPACGRICPQTAIVFPKYDQGGAIAGSDIIDEIAEQQRQSHDIDTILGSDIYKALEMRKAKRQSIIRSTAMQQAIAEREKALAGKNK